MPEEEKLYGYAIHFIFTLLYDIHNHKELHYVVS
jgi:hypothetical protein